ncbi:hypothetical protein [Pelagerythrobacter rhizovicinus]|uniref:Uncharacterized protein n=1 Tax=Pelagerythrobacter rhizovicinus TaxID=2268576 RepID=A0A4Q2KQX5_9SPHN|nr:hypothetical protein [Pelagerythrobacter rhizovicinus]RXZ66032.1 hypothetical protein ETX26_04765 [Pelagerythrobacter rhizovicinus]
MSQPRMLQLAGIVFLVCAMAFLLGDNTALGASFVAIGSAFLAISASQLKSREIRERQEKGGN